MKFRSALSRSKRIIKLIIAGILDVVSIIAIGLYLLPLVALDVVSIIAIGLCLLPLVATCALRFLLNINEDLHHIWLKTVI